MNTSEVLRHLAAVEARCAHLWSAVDLSAEPAASSHAWARQHIASMRSRAAEICTHPDYVICVAHAAERAAIRSCASTIDLSGWPDAWERVEARMAPRHMKGEFGDIVECADLIGTQQEAVAAGIAHALVLAGGRTEPAIVARRATLSAALRVGEATADAFVALMCAMLD